MTKQQSLKKLVFCKNCKWLNVYTKPRGCNYYIYEDCLHRKNRILPNPISGEKQYGRKPKDINKDCNCDWYETKIIRHGWLYYIFKKLFTGKPTSIKFAGKTETTIKEV